MCGIAGVVNYSSTPESGLVNRMLTRIRHRGPDESGIYANPNVAMGNVRLSIIDIASGQQPMPDASQRYWIVYNGELFNHIELRTELEEKGYSFNTQSDTEVILQLYSCYGKEALEKMNGQFAFAIWDKHKEEIFLARDRVGIRPLFYHYNNGEFSFGSEIKAIFENPAIPREFNAEALAQVFTFWTTITPNTVFKDIFELSPGHCMTVNKKGINIEKYWELRFDKVNNSYTCINEAVEEFDKLFADAVKLRLRADVEVAAYLSGGIDSSITTAYIKQIEPEVLNTFSIGFQEDEFDETTYQFEASKYLETRHNAIKCSSQEIAEKFPSVIWHSETPVIRTAPTPMYLLSKLVHDNNIKVVITGEGADEILAGYNIFKESEVRRFWAKYPDSKLRPLLLKKLYPYLPQMKNASAAMLKFFFGFKLEETDVPWYSHLLRWNNASHIKKHFNVNLSSALGDYNPYKEIERLLPEGFNDWSSLAKAQWIETSVFMSGYLLSSQGDRMGMGNSIEGRYPFLDHRLIEFCASLPPGFKLKGLTEKYLVKKLIKGKIPDRIVNRSKQAYRAPIASTFLNESAPDYIKEMLSEEVINEVGVFNASSILTLIVKMEKSSRTSEVENMILTSVISTHLLYKQFIKGDYEELTDELTLKSRIINDN
jgi:asparagine synthase (glutamine-hydrolysing)